MLLINPSILMLRGGFAVAVLPRCTAPACCETPPLFIAACGKIRQHVQPRALHFPAAVFAGAKKLKITSCFLSNSFKAAASPEWRLDSGSLLRQSACQPHPIPAAQLPSPVSLLAAASRPWCWQAAARLTPTCLKRRRQLASDDSRQLLAVPLQQLAHGSLRPSAEPGPPRRHHLQHGKA